MNHPDRELREEKGGKPQLSDEEKKRRRERYRRAREERLAKIDRDNLPEVLTVDEAAVLLRINVKTVREHFHQGILPGRKIGVKVIRFHRDTVISWLRGQSCVSRSRRRR